ncbi:MAG: protein arginine kinase [Parachlamydiaceae bacterium]|nr:protein arginine kinase [Parachlamydiaceae bacterium]
MSNPDSFPHPFLCKESSWEKNPNPIWLGSTVTLSRNLEKLNFPGKLATDKKKQIISLISKDLISSSHLKNPKLILAEEMPPIEKEFLVEHFLSEQGFNQTHIGEAFLLDDSGEFLAVINLQDHLFLHLLDVNEELEASWNQLIKIESQLNQSLNFAFSPKFGFLTSDPTQCGTALIVHVFLHLPALLYTDRLDDIVKKSQEEGIQYSGLQGNPTELIGDIVSFRNRYTLGLSEENILSSLRTLATKLVVEEKGVRQHLKNENENELAVIKDKVSRAYAILLHSYQIEAVEALESLSLLKLGLDLEWLKGITQSELNKLLFSTRRGHLHCHYNQIITLDKFPHLRAEFIHQALKNVELLI